MTHVDYEPKDSDTIVGNGKATYSNIKFWVRNNFGLSVSSLYIAQIKDKLGLSKERVGNSWSQGKNHTPQCPPEKENAIREAFKYFGLV